MPLTNKQQRFVAEYVVDCNATQAAIRAGYSKKTAGLIGHENLHKPKIADGIAKAQQAALDDAGLRAADVLREVRRGLSRDYRRLFNKQNNVHQPSDVDDDTASMVSGVDVVKRNLVGGDGHTDEVIKVRLEPKAKYVELGMKHLGLLQEKQVHTGEIKIKHELG